MADTEAQPEPTKDELIRDLQSERDDAMALLERLGVPWTGPDGRFYTLPERISVLARWTSGRGRR